jgi:S-adenosylmethionine:tRNA ribosyltransferase-isomerase
MAIDSDLLLSSYDFHLPPQLIADRPVPDRHSSRLLVYEENSGKVTHSTFREISQFLPSRSTLIFNRSRVFPCRLMGRKSTGGEAQVFILSLMAKGRLYPCMIRASGKRREGEEYEFGELRGILKEVVGDGTFFVEFNYSHEKLLEELEEIGKIPIPPYIRGGISDEQDKKNYQTVYAQEVGSVAAPTAGLHFSQELLDDLKLKGHRLASLTLHVGAGTFAPIKTENILEHQMHEEFYSIDRENLSLIQQATFRLAVGTTSLRTLESAWGGERVEFDQSQGFKSTSIFLHPGKKVHSIDALVTNFHLPKSSLIMLVSSLIGRKKTLELYDLAVRERYRFFSYGDGMLILRSPERNS